MEGRTEVYAADRTEGGESALVAGVDGVVGETRLESWKDYAGARRR